MSDGVTIRSAAGVLLVSEHHVRLLIRTGNLLAVGTGQGRKVTLESLEAYRQGKNRRRKKTDISVRNSPISVAVSVDAEQDRNMEQILRTVQPLTEPKAVARRLGIPAEQVEQMVKRGDIPSVKVGSMKYVPGFWLGDVLARAYGVTR